MPELCITIGMKQILASRKIYIALNRPWQHGPLKHVLLDPEQPQWPATLLRRVKELQYCMTSDIAKGIVTDQEKGSPWWIPMAWRQGGAHSAGG